MFGHKKISFNYADYNKTGRKQVIKNRDISVKMVDHIDEEIIIKKKIGRFYIQFDISALNDVNDLEKGIAKLEALVDDYEAIHLKLKRDTDIEYNEAYTDY